MVHCKEFIVLYKMIKCKDFNLIWKQYLLLRNSTTKQGDTTVGMQVQGKCVTQFKIQIIFDNTKHILQLLPLKLMILFPKNELQIVIMAMFWWAFDMA